MANYGNNVGIVPLTDAAGITQGFKAGKHYGVDIGWYKEKYCNILAWQDGQVEAKGYYSDTGYYVVLGHYYGSSKRWTCYIHMKQAACVNVGQKVSIGQKIGIRGTSGNSTGVHLHFYLTKLITKTKAFSFSNLKQYAIDPRPYLYYDPGFNTIYISKDWTKKLPAPVPDVVDPVSRDITKDQIICHEADLRVRTAPSLSAEKIGHLLKDKYYNYLDSRQTDGYTWYQLAPGQWCAKISSLEVLPANVFYKVVEGDTIPAICERLGISIESLVNMNPAIIQPGDVLKVKE